MAGYKKVSAVQLNNHNSSQEIALINQYASLRDLPPATALKNLLRRVLPIEITKLEDEIKKEVA